MAISRSRPCFTASTYFVKSVLPPGLTGTQLVRCVGEQLYVYGDCDQKYKHGVELFCWNNLSHLKKG